MMVDMMRDMVGYMDGEMVGDMMVDMIGDMIEDMMGDINGGIIFYDIIIFQMHFISLFSHLLIVSILLWNQCDRAIVMAMEQIEEHTS